MPRVEVRRTLVKSPPELWGELRGERFSTALGAHSVRALEPERRLAWEGDGTSGEATLEPAGWGTRVTLTADLEAVVARRGLFARLRGRRGDADRGPAPASAPELEQTLAGLLDELGSDHRKPFARE